MITRPHILVAGTTGTHPSRRSGVPFDDYPKLLPRCCAFVAVLAEDATTPSSVSCRFVLRPPLCVLPRTPVLPKPEGRWKEAPRGSSFPERGCGAFALSPWLWTRIGSWKEHPSSRPRLHNGYDALITATSRQGSAFEAFRTAASRGRKHPDRGDSEILPENNLRLWQIRYLVINHAWDMFQINSSFSSDVEGKVGS